jgi:glycine/D-amino acid oxidase-like deaminating enzyme
MRVLVSGGGIAGLTLAYWLHQYGIPSVVIEQAQDMRNCSAAQLSLILRTASRSHILETSGDLFLHRRRAGKSGRLPTLLLHTSGQEPSVRENFGEKKKDPDACFTNPL